MARTIRNAKLDTVSARAKLAKRREPYWVILTRGRALGYRRGAKGGTWIARLRVSGGTHYTHRIGPADDANVGPDGGLSYAGAQERARKWFAEKARALALGIDGKPYTVADALDDYLADYEGRGGKALVDVRHRINTAIRPRLGEKIVADLRAQDIREWHRKLASERPRVRSKKVGKDAGKVQYRKASDDPDATRKRRHSANRVLSILKAALNHAFHENKVATDEAWKRAKPFQGVDEPRVRYLSHDECVRLVNASAPDFRKLVRAALYTGCRYGELIRFRVGDFNLDTGTVQVRESKTDKPRHVWLTAEGREFFKTQAAGRPGNETLFLREDGERWGASHQQRPLAAACAKAEIAPPASFHVLRHTYASSLVMNGVPIGVVAQNLGHRGTRMTERHYAHLAPSYVADAIRAGAKELGIKDETNVTPLGEARAAKKRARRG